MPRHLLRFLHAAPAGEPVADADLLRRFAATRDEAAFELLVRRHADLVWAACRGVLRQDADAEDAFQAAFLALARKAAAVRGPCVAGWLHRVAVHAALKLRARLARATPTDPAALRDLPAPAADRDLAAAVHEELARLPDSYRLPVLLCDLEGHTHAAAAALLGWPVGTVSGRLSRARDLLRRRLARLGVTAAVAAASAPPPAVRAAVSAAAGGAVSPTVASLTEGVLAAMRTTKLKLLAAVSAAAVGLTGVGVMLAAGQDRKPGEGPRPGPVAKAGADKPDPDWNKPGEAPSAFPDLKPIEVKDPRQFGDELQKFFAAERLQVPPVLESDPPLKRLQKARLRALAETLKFEIPVLILGRPGEPLSVMEARILTDTRDMVMAALDVHDRPADRRAWLEAGVRLHKMYEALMAARVDRGLGSRDEKLVAQRYRLDAEIALATRVYPPEMLAK